MQKTIIQLGNISPPRQGFDNPQEGRVYSPRGISPSIRVGGGRCYTYSDMQKKVINPSMSILPEYCHTNAYRILRLDSRYQEIFVLEV